MRVLVIGSANIDYSLSVPRFPEEGETLIAPHLKINYGGKGANQAVALARSGIEVGFLASFGKGSEGEEYLKYLKEEGVDVSNAMQVNDNTGSAFIAVDEQAENKIVVYPGANHQITPQDIQSKEAYISQFDFCLLQFELPMDVIVESLKMAKKHHLTTIVNPAPYHSQFPAEALAHVDYLLPNEIEYASLLRTMKLKDYHGHIIRTEGQKGSSYLNEKHHQKAIAVNAVDTTAAGDTYVGYFVSALAQGKKVKEAMLEASYASAMAVTKTGAQRSIPNREELETFMKKNK